MTEEIDRLMKQALRARRENRLADAQQDFTEAVALCRESSAPGELAAALAGLAQIENDLHHGDLALRHYEEGAAIYRTEGNPLKLAHTIRHVADIHRRAGNHRLANGCYEEALRIYRSHPETPTLDLANALRGSALLKEAIGELIEARAQWREAGKLYADVHVEAGVAESRRRLELLEV